MGQIAGNTALRSLEAKYLKNDGVIDAKEAKELAALAKKEKVDQNTLRNIYANDAFDSKDARKAFGKAITGDKPASSPYAGRSIGDAKVLRGIGAEKGYDNRYEAIAAARMTGVKNAAVIVGADNKWHAVELDKASQQRGPAGKDLFYAEGLPALDQGKIDGLRGKLQAELGKSSPDASVVNDLRTKLASATLGVPEAEINIIGKSGNRVEGKININTGLKGGADPLGKHGAEHDHGEGFDPHAGSAIEISSAALEGKQEKKDGKLVWTDPKADQALGVMFHESSHLQDYKVTSEWVKKWEGEKPGLRSFTPGGDNSAFTTWMLNQKGVDQATKNLVVNTSKNANADTEARAYIGAFTAALQSGSPELAKQQLETYAWGVKNGKINPVAQPHAVNKALAEAERAYRELPADMQVAFKDAMDAAKAMYGSWPGSKFNHKTALKQPV